MLHYPTLLIVLWACSIAYFDARYRRIPNVLSLGAWVLGATVLLVQHSSLTGAKASSALIAAGLGLLLTLPAYLIKKLGAGDVKLLVGIGLLTSFPITMMCFFVAAMCGGLLALVWLNLPTLTSMLPLQRIPSTSGIWRWLAIPVKERRMAYGTFLALGLVVALWSNPS